MPEKQENVIKRLQEKVEWMDERLADLEREVWPKPAPPAPLQRTVTWGPEK